MLSEIFVCVSTPTPLSVAPEIEKIGCVSTPNLISVISVEGEV